jgi:conjugative transfer signal peptidase TraF
MTRVFVIVAAIFSIATCCLAVEFKANGIIHNHSNSMPVGYYRTTDVGPIERGMIVVTCYPRAVAETAKEHDYLRSGKCIDGLEPMIKTVAGIPGDRITVSKSGVSVNGRQLPNSRFITKDIHGIPLKHVAFGSFVVPKNTVWLETVQPHSWDSRYWGLMPDRYLQSRAYPILTN